MTDEEPEPIAEEKFKLGSFQTLGDSAFFLCRQSGENAQLSALSSPRSKENNPNVFDFIGRSPTIEFHPRRSSKENQFRTTNVGATVCCTDSEGLPSYPAFGPFVQSETNVESGAGIGPARVEYTERDSSYRFEILARTRAQSSAELRTESTLHRRPCFFQQPIKNILMKFS